MDYLLRFLTVSCLLQGITAVYVMPFSLENPFRHFNPFFGRYVEGERAVAENSVEVNSVESKPPATLPITPLILLYISDHLDGKKSECLRLYSYLSYRSSSIEKLHAPMNLTEYREFHSDFKKRMNTGSRYDAEKFEEQCFMHLQSWNANFFTEKTVDDNAMRNLVNAQPMDKKHFAEHMLQSGLRFIQRRDLSHWLKSTLTRIGIDKVRKIFEIRLSRENPSLVEIHDDSRNRRVDSFISNGDDIPETVIKPRKPSNHIAIYVFLYFMFGIFILLVFFTLIYLAGERIVSPSKQNGRQDYQEIDQKPSSPKSKSQRGTLIV